MQIQFLGAARGVTGSKFLVTTNKGSSLTDCGLTVTEGDDGVLDPRDEAFVRTFGNYGIDSITYSHGHTDHSQLTAQLVRSGFSGNIYGTSPTNDIAKKFMFTHAGGSYEKEHAHQASEAMRSKRFYEPFEVAEGMTATLIPAWGHILGAASVLLEVEENGSTLRILFSGDLGNLNKTMNNKEADIPEADIVVVESTYGRKEHHMDFPESRKLMIDRVNATLDSGGISIIPILSVDRTQDILFQLNLAKLQGAISGDKEVVLDTKLGREMTRIYGKYKGSQYFSDHFREQVSAGLDPFAYKKSPDDDSYILLATAGLSGQYGTLQKHADKLEDKSNEMMTVTHVIENSGLDRLSQGQSANIGGRSVNTQVKTVGVDGFSSHADRTMLLKWIKATKAKKVFLVHGSDNSMEQLSAAIEKQIAGAEVTIPELGGTYNLLPAKKGGANRSAIASVIMSTPALIV